MLFLLSQLFCSLNNSDKESNSFKFSFSFSILHIIHAPVINFDCFLAMLLGLVSYYKQKNAFFLNILRPDVIYKKITPNVGLPGCQTVLLERCSYMTSDMTKRDLPSVEFSQRSSEPPCAKTRSSQLLFEFRCTSIHAVTVTVLEAARNDERVVLLQ